VTQQAEHTRVAGTATGTVRFPIVVGALGVVFGDIGTSPIYTVQTVFSPADPHPVPPTPANIYGVTSLIFWSITCIVTVTYVTLAMRVDNDGEGGIMALITLLKHRNKRKQRPRARRTRMAAGLAMLGVLGAALFLGDSMITPAISVLSAVEGLKVVDQSLAPVVIPITVVIIALLFALQRFGTATVGGLFGPVMALWFTVIAACGVTGIVREPAILKAVSPTYAVAFVSGHPAAAFFALATVVLAVTGAEALYADMGAFGRRPIQVAWLLLVFPACALSYFGQAGLVLRAPAALSAPFFLLAPAWAYIPLVVIATTATVIASQAVIAGAFSLTAQAARLGYLPRIRIVHTSATARGQIYVPWINWLLAVSVITLVFAFRSSASLAYAYGMAVTGTILTTTILLFYVASSRWHVPRTVLIAGATVLGVIDLCFVAANLTKLTHGAWLPLVVALAAFTVMTTWQRGRGLVTARRHRLEGGLRAFVTSMRDDADSIRQVDGTAVFLSRSGSSTPLALRATVERNHVRHRHILIVRVRVENVPRIAPSARARSKPVGESRDRIDLVTLRFGYMEPTDVPKALARLTTAGPDGDLDLDNATYFLSTIAIHPGGPRDQLSPWRQRLFIATSHLTAETDEQFHLPRRRVVLIGEAVQV
jgi:KUP system potassium uptake protein